VPAGAVLDYYNNVEATIGTENARGAGRSTMCRDELSAMAGPGHGHLRHAGCLRAGSSVPGADGRGASRVETESRAHAALCPYPQVRRITQREHERRELRVPVNGS